MPTVKQSPRVKKAIVKVKSAKPDDSPSGIMAYFVPLDKNWGIKVYEYTEERDYCYKWQKMAAEHGLGPKVGEKFSFDGKYCYITEKVYVIWNGLEKQKEYGYNPYADYDEASSNAYKSYCAEYNALAEKYKYDIGELCDRLESIGFHFGDCHIGNIGIKNGDVICIDFGDQ